jgi:hypothetical protein
MMPTVVLMTRRSRYEEAVQGWGEALACLRAARAPDTAEGVRQLRVTLHNNRAMALLQLGRYSAVEAECTEALCLEPTNSKALYRCEGGYPRTPSSSCTRPDLTGISLCMWRLFLP